MIVKVNPPSSEELELIKDESKFWRDAVTSYMNIMKEIETIKEMSCTR